MLYYLHTMINSIQLLIVYDMQVDIFVLVMLDYDQSEAIHPRQQLLGYLLTLYNMVIQY
jgi:hypothetical protein